MNKKRTQIIFLIIGAVFLVAGGLIMKNPSIKQISGACIGIGAGLWGIGIANLLMSRYYQKHPQAKKQEQIQQNDERNIQIRDKAKAKSADILQWVIMAGALVSIVVNAPLWVTLAIVAVFLSKTVLELYFMHIFQQQM